MSFVGELIMGLREAAPDLPVQVYPPPNTPLQLTGITSTIGALAASTLYFFKVTLIFPWGETLPSGEASITIGVGQNAVTMSLGGGQPGMLGFRVYVGTVLGAENAFAFFPSPFINAFPQPNVTITFLGYPLQFGAPPSLRNTAYVPDTDGRLLSAARVFGWLNEGIGLAGQIAGGLPNCSGVNSVVGQPFYVLNGNWRKIDGAWYNGYPVFFGRRQDVFRKNSVLGISAAIIVNMYTDRVAIELWPQPSAAGGQSTLAASIGTTDVTVAIAAASPSFQTNFGFVQIGTGSTAEIVSVQSNSNNTLTGMIRGWGGTRPTAWTNGTPVFELNGMISGLIIPSPYSPGDSATTLFLPPGWADALHKYLLSRFREAEHRRADAKALKDEFTAIMQNLRTTRQYAGPIQIQANVGRGAETYPGLGGPFGGVIVP